MEPLLKAAMDGDIQLVKDLIANGADVNTMPRYSMDRTSYSPLMLAAENGHLSVVQYLHQHGANITLEDRNKYSAIHYASEKGHLDVLSCLVKNLPQGYSIDKKVSENPISSRFQYHSPLSMAAKNGHLSVVKYLHGKGANITDSYIRNQPLFWATTYGKVHVVEYLKQNGAYDKAEDPLLMAAAFGNLSMVQNLSEGGSNVNALGYLDYTPIIWAARMGHLPVLKYLHSIGADLEAKTEDVSYSGGETPLFLASKYGHLEVVKFLHENGANVFAEDVNRDSPIEIAVKDSLEIFQYLHEIAGVTILYQTPLYLAAKYGQLEIVQYLVKNGAEVNARQNGQNDRYTALHAAASNNHLDVVKHLVENGADINSKVTYTYFGGIEYYYTPIAVAAQSSNFLIVKYLVENGAEFKEDAETINGAAGRGSLQILEYLHENGANLNATNYYGNNAIYAAAENQLCGNLPATEYLVENGVDVNAKGYKNQTPLLRAMIKFEECIPFIQFLVENGADVNAVSDFGDTPLSEAESNLRPKFVAYLRANGAV